MNKRRNVAFGNIDPDELEYYSERAADKPRGAGELAIKPGDPESGVPGARDVGISDIWGFDSGSGSGNDSDIDPDLRAGSDLDYGSGLTGLSALERGAGTREELIKNELSEYAKTNPEAIALIIKEMFRKE